MSIITSSPLIALTVPSTRLPFLNFDSCPALASISAIAADFSPGGVGFLIAIMFFFLFVSIAVFCRVHPVFGRGKDIISNFWAKMQCPGGLKLQLFLHKNINDPLAGGCEK